MIEHSNTLEHLDLPELSEKLHERLEARRSHYERIMAQHETLRHEEKIRYIRDLMILLAAFLAIVGLIVRLAKHHK
ncbi:MAG: hypothetical protein HUJ55_00870 [Ileibacterium sp.]|nr:hypothetical protein [Ileibacterium sp.]